MAGSLFGAWHYCLQYKQPCSITKLFNLWKPPFLALDPLNFETVLDNYVDSSAVIFICRATDSLVKAVLSHTAHFGYK